ncbi:MAG TPA: D-glycerate dehydrogenase [Candidatus Atribacteria bacterium]|nr:D-glycerate dehydrogenase [Candidatus Atribacteria bacterium]
MILLFSEEGGWKLDKKPRVLVTRRIPQEGLNILEESCQVEVSEYDGVLPREILLQKVKGVDGILCLLTDNIDRKVMEAAGQSLRVISNYAVGYDNIDIEEATRRRIMVTNTPGVLTETTADLTWALLMAVARRIAEGDRFVREGKFREWEPLLFLGDDVYGATLGIIGLGRIGQAVARRARGFNMQVIYFSHHRLEDKEKELGVTYYPFLELLAQSDFITLHVPLTRETYHLIGEEELKMMKKESYLINTSRGSVIDEKALIRALKEGWIRGAALDVFEQEPQVEPELLELEEVVLTPHLGSASRTTRTKMAILAANNLALALRGEIPPYLVNLDVVK